jgi:hypothetical protein
MVTLTVGIAFLFAVGRNIKAKVNRLVLFFGKYLLTHLIAQVYVAP